jgi:hypothetical protein
MSLTNPKNVVIEERLSEFYKEILPYLGGMPEILANMFSKADLYSTDEKIVGCWTDGRPLYQKTFVDIPFVKRSGVTINQADAVLFNPTESANLNLVGYEGLLLKNASGDKLALSTMLTGNTNYSNQEVYQTWTVIQTSNLGITVSTTRNDNTAVTGRTATVTIRYTKTTDATNSFKYGNETDYSTEEKIVGTWIDGKPIYQKTINFGALPNTTSKFVDHNISNLSQIIDSKTMVYTGTSWIALSYISPGNLASAIYCSVTPTQIKIETGADRSSWTAYVTVQYTKTTD